MTDQMETLGTPEPKRDGYGRYLITPPDGGKAVAMTRATTVAKAIDDTEGLQKWMKRQVAFGMGQRPDLVAAAATTEHTDKKRLAGIAEDAMSAAGSSAAATVGTALHRATELADLGLEVPEMFAERVAEYRRCLDANGIKVDPKLVECVLVLWDQQIAGTADRIVTVGGRHYVFDLKTGESVYPHSFALQLAIYAAAEDVADMRVASQWEALRRQLANEVERLGLDIGGKADAWTYSEMVEKIEHHALDLLPPSTPWLRPMPEVDQDRAIICHLPAKGGPCTLHWIDISAGREALEHALWVRSWRRRRDLLVPFDVPEVTNDERTTADLVVEAFPGTTDDLGPRRQRLLATLPFVDDAFKAKWRAELPGVPGPKKADAWTLADLEAVERAFELPFSDDPLPVDPPKEPTTVADVVELRPRPALGGPVDAAALQMLRERARRQSNGVKAWIKVWQAECIEDGAADFKMGRGSRVTLWAYEVSRAAMYLARLVERAETPEAGLVRVRQMLGEAIGTVVEFDGVTVGAVLGSLSLDEATAIADLATDTDAAEVAS